MKTGEQTVDGSLGSSSRHLPSFFSFSAGFLEKVAPRSDLLDVFFVRMDVDVLFGEVYHGLIMCFVHLVCIV